jgi:hypothetical protein
MKSNRDTNIVGCKNARENTNAINPTAKGRAIVALVDGFIINHPKVLCDS